MITMRKYVETESTVKKIRILTADNISGLDGSMKYVEIESEDYHLYCFNKN